jgi:hypothetical protein
MGIFDLPALPSSADRYYPIGDANHMSMTFNVANLRLYGGDSPRLVAGVPEGRKGAVAAIVCSVGFYRGGHVISVAGMIVST